MRCPETTEKKNRIKKEKTIKFTPEEAKRKVDEILAEKIQLKEEKLKALGKEKNERNILERDSFILLERNHLSSFFVPKRLRGPLALYLYLRSYVNRRPHATLLNLGKYFQEGYLATGRTQSYLKRELDVPQTTFSFWFSVLEQEGLIVQIGTEKLKIKNVVENVPIYALGEIRVIDGYTQEIWYAEAL